MSPGRVPPSPAGRLCRTIPWAASSGAIVGALARFGSGVEFVACEHDPVSAPPATIHRDALAVASAPRSCGCRPSFDARACRISPDELFGWAYDRRRCSLLRLADGPAATAALERRWAGRAPAGYGPFRRADGEDPDELIWLRDISELHWGFACLILPPGAGPEDSLLAQRLLGLLDELILSSPGDGVEAFHWRIVDPHVDESRLGYEAWTVRSSPQRIVVIQEPRTTANAHPRSADQQPHSS